MQYMHPHKAVIERWSQKLLSHGRHSDLQNPSFQFVSTKQLFYHELLPSLQMGTDLHLGFVGQLHPKRWAGSPECVWACHPKTRSCQCCRGTLCCQGKVFKMDLYNSGERWVTGPHFNQGWKFLKSFLTYRNFHRNFLISGNLVL